MYRKVPDFKLPDCLMDQLYSLKPMHVWKTLAWRTNFGPTMFLYGSYLNNCVFDFLKTYGLALQHIGTIISAELPNELESAIREEIKQQLHPLIANEAIIRLQVVYGGQLIPVHIDKTRNSSFIYPISHPHVSSTEFYDYTGPDLKGVIPPRWCKLTQQVSIDNTPTLIDTSIPHAIRWGKGTYTKKDPRLSLTIKFEQLEFESIVNMIKCY